MGLGIYQYITPKTCNVNLKPKNTYVLWNYIDAVFEVKPNLFLGTQLKSGECLNEIKAKTMAQKWKTSNAIKKTNLCILLIVYIRGKIDCIQKQYKNVSQTDEVSNYVWQLQPLIFSWSIPHRPSHLRGGRRHASLR